MPGTTGDITWRQLDPKTVELYNTDRGGAAPPPPDSPPVAPPAAPQKQDPALAQRMLEESMRADPSTQVGKVQYPNAKEKLQHKKAARNFDKYLRSPDATPEGVAQGVQELLDNKTIWFSDKSWDTFGINKLNPKQADRLMQATDAYRDFMDQHFGQGWERTGKPLDPWQQEMVDNYEKQKAADPLVQQRTAEIRATMGY
jgi:hypothetical protein